MKNTVSEQESYDSVSFELLADAHPDFDTRNVFVRCVSCKREVLTTLGELKQKFRQDNLWRIHKKHLKIRIPFTSYYLALSLWQVEEATSQEKMFLR